LQEPLILLMSGIVLVSPEGMGHSVNVIDDRARKVICGISFVLRPKNSYQHGSVEGFWFADPVI